MLKTLMEISEKICYPKLNCCLTKIKRIFEYEEKCKIIKNLSSTKK